MTQIIFHTSPHNLIYHLVHNRNLGYIIGGIFRTKHHQIQSLNLDTIVLLEHIAIEVLLHTVVIEYGVGQTYTVLTHPLIKGLCDRLSKGVHHLTASLPVVDGKGAIALPTDQVDGACDVQVFIIDGPLLAIGLDVIILNKMQELLLFFLETDRFLLTLIGKGIVGFEGAVLKVTFCLSVDKGAHFAGLFATIIPTI